MQGNGAKENRGFLRVFYQRQQCLLGTGAGGNCGPKSKCCSARRRASCLPEPSPRFHPFRRGQSAASFLTKAEGEWQGGLLPQQGWVQAHTEGAC